MDNLQPDSTKFNTNSKNIFEVTCRVCLHKKTKVKSVFDNINITNNDMLVSELIVICASVQIFQFDELPKYICDECLKNAIISYKFRIQCETSDKILRSDKEKDETFPSLNLNKSSKQEIQNLFDVEHVTVHKRSTSRRSSLSNNKRIRSYKCTECGLKFSMSSDLSRHKQDHTNRSSLDVERRTCTQCGKTFQYRASMLKHQRRHNAPPKTCPYCDFQPFTANKLAQHMEQVHANLKTIVCTVCGKAFFKETNLRLHMIVHSGVKRHTCEICGMSFALGGNLTAHRRLHTGEKPYTCSHCGRGFTQQSALRSHEAGHSDRKDHICPECGTAFSRAGALRNHRKRHSPTRPFQCSMCGKAFTFSSEMKRHMTIHTGDKSYVCEICGRRFNRSANLKVHRRIHTGETPYICSICGKGFIQAHCLRTHMKIHQNSSTL